MQMIAYLGWYRNTEIKIKPIDLTCGIGKVKCFECDGTGDWTEFHPEPELGPFECVQCKGTGYQYISI